MTKSSKEKKWFKPLLDFEDDMPVKVRQDHSNISHNNKDLKLASLDPMLTGTLKSTSNKVPMNIDNKNWMKNFEPVKTEDLAVNSKKVQEVDLWIKLVSEQCNSDMLLLSGPVGCGKTITIHTVAAKYGIKISEWITPVDIDIPTDYGDFEFREKQSAKFQDFIISAANYTSLLDNNSKKLVLVEDFPNTFLRNISEFTGVLEQYKIRAKSPIVFICSECNTENKNSVLNLFTPQLKEKFGIHHISLNAVAPTSLKAALKRVSEIIIKKFSSVYNSPTSDLIECVSNSSAGDVRSAVLNLHFACLKGASQNLETSLHVEKSSKSKTTKKRKATSKFMSIGKDQSVNILHGVGRVLNPKVDIETKKLTHTPAEVVEQFLSQPGTFVNFAEENYLPHFSCITHAQRAASAISDADYMLAEWREKMCQEYGVYIAAAGLMLANKAPVSAWNPVRGPKNMKILYPTIADFPQLETPYLYNPKVLVSDYKTYCNIIGNPSDSVA